MLSPGPALAGTWLIFTLVYVGGFIFVLTLAWRITKGVERIAVALERRPIQ